MNILEQSKNEEFVKEQFIKGRILDDTKDYGRTQFVDEIYKLQQENKQLKMINKEYKRLNKENGRGFKITNVQEYDIYELLSYKNYKDNWNKLKEYFNERIEVCDNRLSSPFCNFEKTTKERLIFSQCLEKLEELEQGSDNK